MIEPKDACRMAAAATLLVVAPSVHAQTSAQADDSDAIVVTARMRSETVQDAPIAISVTSQEALDRVGVTSMTDIPEAVPGLILQKAPGSSQTSVSIRGLGSSAGSASFESSVGLFVNGVYVPRTREFSSSMFDVERIEVVRGTQSSMLGKNTSLGAVNVVTRAPGHDFSIDANASYEGELGSWTGFAGVTVPLMSNLSVRLAGQIERSNGWVKNTFTGGMGPNVDRQSGRVSVAWQPTDTVDVNFIYELQRGDTDGTEVEYISTSTPSLSQYFALLGGSTRFETNFDRQTEMGDSRVPNAISESIDIDRASLSVNWQLGDYLLTGLTGWSRSKSFTKADVDFLPGDYFFQVTDSRSKAYSQEFRLTSPTEKPFRYIVGVFVGRNEYDQTIDSYVNYPADSQAPFYIPSPPAPVPLLINGVTHAPFDQTTNTQSVFAQADYKFLEQLTLSGGVRYTHEKKDADLSRVILADPTPPNGGFYYLSPPFAPLSLSRTESVVDGLGTLSYRPTDNLMVYVSWAQGTKSGGFADAATDLSNAEYKAEVARTSELGVRYETSDRQLTANATVFYTKVKDYQLVTFTGTQFIINNTDLKSTGIESEIIWRPTFVPGLRFDWANTYAKARDAFTGADIPRAPRWQGSVKASYSESLSNGSRLTLDGTVDYSSSITHQQDPDAAPRAAGITTFGASMGIDLKNGLGFRLIGRNLTNENRYAFDFAVPIVSNPAADPQAFAASSIQPRTIAVQISYHY